MIRLANPVENTMPMALRAAIGGFANPVGTPSRRIIEADLVGMEPDSTRALVLAVEHVLGASEDR